MPSNVSIQITDFSGDTMKMSVYSDISQTAYISKLTAQALQTNGYFDESAVDDDDVSGCGNSTRESVKSPVDDKFFQRVDLKAKLTSQPSLITQLLAQNEGHKILHGYITNAAPAIQACVFLNDPCLAGVPHDSDEALLILKSKRSSGLKPISETTRSNGPLIAATAAHISNQAVLTPRATRRNMLATELTQSLRQHLLWEWQQKTLTAKTSLKRRHTLHDTSSLKQYPDKVCMKPSEDDAEARSWNHYFISAYPNGYPSRGW